MLVFHLIFAVSSVVTLSLVVAGHAPLSSNLEIRNAPRMPFGDDLRAIGRALYSAATPKRDAVVKNSTSIDKTWIDAVLFSYADTQQNGNATLSASVEIVCTTCYIKGTVTAQFTIDSNFNVSQAFSNATAEVETKVNNITTTAIDYVENYVTNLIKTDEFHIDDFDLPPIQIDFDLDIPDIPQCELQVQFDGMELYMQVDTILSGGATYNLNLYTSETEIGVTVGKDLLIGVVFSVDLILSVESEIDISTGFHIQLNDGVAINIPMFDQKVSGITFNGGNFEFLPVIIQSASVVLTAILRVGVKAGLELSTPSAAVDGYSLDFSSGVESGIWTDIAQFTTNVTAGSSENGSICELNVIEEYTMLLGANAGATVAIEEYTWGPTPNTQIPIWYTTIGDVCAVSKTDSTAEIASSAAKIIARDNLTTTTTTTEVTYTALLCLSTGLVNCPVSLQSTSKNTVTKTLVTAIPSGSKPTFPASTLNTVLNTIAFGKNMQSIIATSGSPVSYVPYVPTQSTASKGSSSSTGVIKDSKRGSNKKVIVGVSVGLGVPVLIAVILGCSYYFYKCKRSIGQQGLRTSPEAHTPGSGPIMPGKKTTNVSVVEI